MRRKLLITIIVVLAAALPLAGYWKDQKCKERDKAYKARIAQLDADAKKVAVGGSKQAVEDFFKANELGAEFRTVNGHNYATAHITRIKACSPGWYCGDEALIQIQFTLDKDWHVVSSEVSGGYTNCL